MKVLLVFFIIGAVCVSYIAMTAMWPAIYAVVTSANTTANIGSYTGAREGVNLAPYVLFFVPALIGGVAIFQVLKEEKRMR